MDNKRFQNILIIKPSSLGDVIHALPVAAVLKDAMPDCNIDWVVAKPYREIVESSRNVDRAIVFDRDMFGRPGGLKNLFRFMGELRRTRYDLVIDLQGLMRSGLMTFWARAGLKAGFANAREGATTFYNHRVRVPDTDMHAVDRYMLVPGSLGLPASEPRFDLKVPEPSRTSAKSLLAECGIMPGDRFAAMAPSARWKTKRWGAADFVTLANRLYDDDGVRTVMLGTAADESLLAGTETAQGVGRLFGRTGLMELAAIFDMAAVAVTNDSGPMHISTAVGTPTIAVFGPTSPKRTGPYGKGHLVITAKTVCAPCFKRECDTLRCMNEVSVDTVYNEAVKLLKEG